MTNKRTIVLIVGGEESPLQAIIELLQASGREIHHASERTDRAARVAIGTPTDLHDVKLPQDLEELKLTPEQRKIFELLVGIERKLDTFVRGEKIADTKLTNGLKATGALLPDAPKRGGKKNQGGDAGTGSQPGNTTTTTTPPEDAAAGDQASTAAADPPPAGDEAKTDEQTPGHPDEAPKATEAPQS